jgi:hypothetical protein
VDEHGPIHDGSLRRAISISANSVSTPLMMSSALGERLPGVGDDAALA